MVWSRATEPKARWMGGLLGFRILSGARDLMILIAVRGVLWWSAGLAVAAFVIGTAAGAWLLSRNPHNRIGYLDLVLPTRWDGLRSKRGAALIDEGINEVKNRRYAAGIMLLSHGLRMEPSNLSGRILLGQMLAGGGQLHRAMQVFRGGLKHAAGQQRYIETAFRLADYLEDDALQLDMLDEVAPAVADDDETLHRWLRDRRAEVLVRLGRYAEVADLWSAAVESPSMRLNAAYARALAGMGRAEEAMAQIEAAPDKFGVFGEPWRLLLDIAHTADSSEVGRRAANAMVQADPGDHGLWVERVAYLWDIGAPAEVQPAVEDFFNRFGLNVAARVQLLKRLESVSPRNDVPADLVWRRVTELGQPNLQERIAQVQNLLVWGQLAAARQEYAVARQEIEAQAPEQRTWAEGTGHLLDLLATRSPSSLSQLTAFASTRPLSPEAFRFLIRALASGEAWREAADVAALARNRFPAIRNLPELDRPDEAELAVVPTEIALPVAAIVNNAEGQAALTALQAALTAGEWARALEQIVVVEKSPLAKDIAEQLLYDRIRIHGQLSNQTELLWFLRRLMERPRGFAPARLKSEAEVLHGAGRTDSALTLLREVLRRHPEAKWAADLQQQWREGLRSTPVGMQAAVTDEVVRP